MINLKTIFHPIVVNSVSIQKAPDTRNGINYAKYFSFCQMINYAQAYSRLTVIF